MKAAIIVFVLVVVLQFSESAIDLFGSLEETRDALMDFYDPAPVTRIVKPTIKSDLVAIAVGAKGAIGSIKSKGLKVVTGKIIPKGTGWGSRRRRTSTMRKAIPRRKTTSRLSIHTLSTKHITKPVVALHKKIVKRVQKPSKNKFSEVLEDIEKALAGAQETSSKIKHDLHRLRRLQDLIKTAVAKRSYRFARKAIGEAMYTIARIKDAGKGKGRTKRATVVSGRDFLGDVKRNIGSKAFSDLLAMQGQVTLMFAIDTTGSMLDDITAAKNIAQTIASHPRSEPVDYILSPFTDPVTKFKKVEYFDELQHGEFITALSKITVNGGGDCPEFTFKGMIDAIELGQPLDDSPMYVFTDAEAKDGNEDNIKYLLEIAEELGIVINFFIVDSFCSTANHKHDSFYKIAKGTTGQVFRLKQESELNQLAGITANSLGGTTVISTATNSISFRKKRSSGRQTKTYIIPVDDSIETLVISITADHPHGRDWSVTLVTSKGSSVTPQRMDKVIIYQISTPSIGEWKLQIDSANYVKYDYYAKGSSADNIDFEFYFVKKSKKGVFIPVSNPVKGTQAKAILTLGGVNNINTNSLQAELVTDEGVTFKTSSFNNILKSEDKRGVRYSFTFTPPVNQFKIKLKGKTKKGNSFERFCHNRIELGTLLIKVLSAGNDYTVSPNHKTQISFTIENKGRISERVDIKVFGSRGKVKKVGKKNYVLVRAGRRTSFRAHVVADATASKGDTITIVALVKGSVSKSQASTSVPLLVV